MHEVETMAWSDHGKQGDMPWHGLGVRVEGCMTSDEAIVKAGLDWEVEKKDIFIFKNNDGEVMSDADRMTIVPSHFAVVRIPDQKPLGVVGSRYVPLQNKQAFSWFDDLVAMKEAIYETAGSLRGGKIIWIMAKLPGMMGWADDPIEKWLVLSNTHDGSGKVRIDCSPVRVVCMNTLKAAMGSTEVSYEMLHTLGMADHIPDVREALGAVTTYFIELQGSLETLRGVQMTQEEIKKYVIRLFPARVKMVKDDDLSGVLEAEIGPRIQKQIEKVLELIDIGKGTDIPGVRGTAYGAYNAVVEWADHYRGIKKNGNGLEARVDSAWFGTGAKFKQRAFELALELVSKS
jgi:phage/plasmid-like protein (TIGR03299 family)